MPRWPYESDSKSEKQHAKVRSWGQVRVLWYSAQEGKLPQFPWVPRPLNTQAMEPDLRSNGEIPFEETLPSLGLHSRTESAPSASIDADHFISSATPLSYTQAKHSSAASISTRARAPRSELLNSLEYDPPPDPSVPNAQFPSSPSTSSHALRSPRYGSIVSPHIRDTQPTSSTDAAPMTVQDQMKLCQKLQRKVTTLRDAILETRTTLAFEQKRSEHLRRFVHESLARLTESKDEAINAGTMEDPFAAISELRSTFETDTANLQTQDATVKELQSNLFGQEHELMEEEKKLVPLIFTLCLALGFDLDEAQSEHSVPSESAVVPTESQHPLALEYYSRKGEIQILKERLQDLDYEHRDEQEKRGFLVDQRQFDPEGEIGDTESEFRRKYEDTRQQILTDIVTAEQDTDRLEQECIDAGVELELGPLSNSNAQSVHEVEPAIEDQPKVTYVVPARPNKLLLPHAAAASTLLTAKIQSESMDDRLKSRPTQNRRNIRRWLDDVAAAPDSITPEVELGLGEHTPQSTEVLAGQEPRLSPQETDPEGNHEEFPAQPRELHPETKAPELVHDSTTGEASSTVDVDSKLHFENLDDPLGEIMEQDLP